MNGDRLLCTLQGVRKTGAAKWLARCPAHDDKIPSLAIKELEDGRILLHCFGGCPPSEILDAIGLQLSDLFNDNQIATWQSKGPSRETIEWAQICNLIVDFDRRQGVNHSPEDLQTLDKPADILDQIPKPPKPPKPQGKPKLPPFAKQLGDRQLYDNRPFMVVICAGINAWNRAKDWAGSENDIVGLVVPDCWPESYIWPVNGCIVMVERDLSVNDDVITNLPNA